MSASDVIQRDLEIREIARKNSNFAILRNQAPCYLLKQADPSEKSAGVRHEIDIYSFLQAQSFPWIPRMIDHDIGKGFLILEYITNGIDLEVYHEFRPFVSRIISAKVGRALAALHSLKPTPDLPLRRPWPVTVFRPHIQMLRELSPAALELIKVIQHSPDAAEHFATVRAMWRDANVIHFDIKWPNVVVAPAPGARRITRAWLVDWELAGRGDGYWDVGCVLAQALSYWLMSMRDYGDFSGETLARKARRPPDRMRGGLAAFMHAYVAGRNITARNLPAFLTQIGMYTGARLVHFALENAQPQLVATAPLFLHAQLGMNVMSRPYEAVVQLLGLSPDAII